MVCPMMVTPAMVSRCAPEFNATAVMPDETIKEISLSDYKGKYVLLYFWPLDFTFVCPSEIIAFDDICEELESKNVVLLGCSVDSHVTHIAWRKTPRHMGGIGRVRHPLISDITKAISKSYNVLLRDEGISLRGLFLIDKDGILRHQIVNDLPLGRSTKEVLRIIDALQHSEVSGEVCPANWKKGDEAIIPTAEGIRRYFRTK